MQKVLFFDENGSSLGFGRFTERGRCTVSKSRLRTAGKKISLKTSVSVLDLHGHFVPDNIGGPAMKLDWVIRFTGAFQRNYPLIAFFSQEQENRGTLFCDNLFDDFECQAKLNQEKCCYDVTFTFSVRPETRAFHLYCDRESGNWTRAVNRALHILRPDGIPAFPDSAFDPVYCTWYAVHAALDMRYLNANAERAAALGFRTFIVDDGWCVRESKRVSPETIGTWYDRIGDWKVIGRKLPKFAEHVARAQQLGLRYMLWVTPFFAGSRSDFYQGIKERANFLTPLHEGYRIFDPADPALRAASSRKLLAVMKKYNLDGLKIDFVDAVPQSLDAPRGREVMSYMKKLVGAMRRIKPDALIEFRQRYCTPQMLDYGTQFRAGDVPFDFIVNLRRIAHIRTIVGDNVPVHADPVYWHDDETPANVARHMIAACGGVPMLSMDLRKLKARHQEIVEHYLRFYAAHRETFAHGHWTIKYQFDSLGYLSVESRHEKIIILLDQALLDEARAGFKGDTHLLNLSCVTLPGKAEFNPESGVQQGIPRGGHGLALR